MCLASPGDIVPSPEGWTEPYYFILCSAGDRTSFLCLSLIERIGLAPSHSTSVLCSADWGFPAVPLLQVGLMPTCQVSCVTMLPLPISGKPSCAVSCWTAASGPHQQEAVVLAAGCSRDH